MINNSITVKYSLIQLKVFHKALFWDLLNLHGLNIIDIKLFSLAPLAKDVLDIQYYMGHLTYLINQNKMFLSTMINFSLFSCRVKYI